MTAHPLEPIYDEHSEILILGSFPSVRSREKQFYYAHPQNRFWKVLAAIFDSPLPETNEERCALLLRNRIALWDVIASCEITGSADSSITNVVVNDIPRILRTANIRKIFINGKTAMKYYDRYLRKQLGLDAVCLPSTSPANAAWNLEALIRTWRQIRLDNLCAK